MIHFVVPEAGSFSIRACLSDEGRAMAPHMRVLDAESFLHEPALKTGVWAFAAIDQLTLTEREIIAMACAALAPSADASRTLNDPRRALLRSDLLETMERAGINRFRARRADAIDGPGQRDVLRYPVFVREANRHTGNLTPLLHDDDALDAALLSLRLRGFRRDELLVVEFCDTADDHGVYRKYSAFRVGDHILPRYLNFSTHWMIKHQTRLYDLDRADEELAYLSDNPHESWLRRVFDLAGIEYGRIDYGMLGDTPQLWEINTNPTIGRVGPRQPRPPEVEAYRNRIASGREQFYQRFTRAWIELDTGRGPTCPVPFLVPQPIRDRQVAENRTRRRLGTRRRIYDRLASFRIVRAVRRLIQPTIARITAHHHLRAPGAPLSTRPRRDS
ncbi:MAG: hypothetical protein L0271_05045 [Gemmatimonadetes bacterium]|nr:hypothetical protein [Gemmatimonadota bacterium]